VSVWAFYRAGVLVMYNTTSDMTRGKLKIPGRNYLNN
jgi:hypothetical protein